ncbi:MarR family transcriptional regulator [Parahaliea maris]|uniref:MarR family transcriptional regulator n=1 Tax=Parahaliea maris TaxID=2716870 RepID=A0A5C9A624_9GAMM|nr:MarR family transcriptional regulator [Parahaliea maris]TXS96146.1 MarR family transcriptional regulator [Parahaliea maris]
MKPNTSQIDSVDPTWSRYRDNFPRQVMGVTRYLQSQVMERLVGEHGFDNLRLYFEPYISLVPDAGIRLTDLADELGISRQAANQTANQIELAGFIERAPDPSDGRAKRILLTERGSELRRLGLVVADRLESDFCRLVGRDLYDRSVEALTTFCEAKDILPPVASTASSGRTSLVALLPRFSDYLSQRLMEITIDRGHSGLKLSYAQILALIGPEGGRMLKIAALQNVSKQAISAIANELEDEGYIYREQDPEDARQVLLRFTGFGRRLIEDSVNGIDDLEAEIRGTVGPKALDSLRSTMKRLYHALQPEVAVFTRSEPDLMQLENELRQRLSPEARRQLAERLLRD